MAKIFEQGASNVVASSYPFLRMPKYIKSLKHVSKKKRFIQIKKHRSLEPFEFLFCDRFFGFLLGTKDSLNSKIKIRTLKSTRIFGHNQRFLVDSGFLSFDNFVLTFQINLFLGLFLNPISFSDACDL